MQYLQTIHLFIIFCMWQDRKVSMLQTFVKILMNVTWSKSTHIGQEKIKYEEWFLVKKKTLLEKICTNPCTRIIYNCTRIIYDCTRIILIVQGNQGKTFNQPNGGKKKLFTSIGLMAFLPWFPCTTLFCLVQTYIILVQIYIILVQIYIILVQYNNNLVHL